MLSGTFLTPNKGDDDMQKVFKSLIGGFSASKTPDGHFNNQVLEDSNGRSLKYTTEKKFYVSDSQSSENSSNMFETPYEH